MCFSLLDLTTVMLDSVVEVPVVMSVEVDHLPEAISTAGLLRHDAPDHLPMRMTTLLEAVAHSERMAARVAALRAAVRLARS